MWEPGRLTTLWAFTVCYRVSFTIYYLTVLPFFSIIWWMQKIWSAVDLLCRNRHKWYPRISSTYGLYIERRMLHKILHEVDEQWYSWIITTLTFSAFLVYWYNNRYLPLLRQLFLILNTVNVFRALRTWRLTSCLNQLYWNLITTWRFTLFELCNSKFNLVRIRLRY
jgi:hypothetical protein